MLRGTAHAESEVFAQREPAALSLRALLLRRVLRHSRGAELGRRAVRGGQRGAEAKTRELLGRAQFGGALGRVQSVFHLLEPVEADVRPPFSAHRLRALQLQSLLKFTQLLLELRVRRRRPSQHVVRSLVELGLSNLRVYDLL